MSTQRPSADRLRGRAGELRAVADLLGSAATGHGAILLVDGAPGVGKTCLLAAAEERATRQGFNIARGQVDELPRPLPLAPLFSGLDLAPPAGTQARAPADLGQLLACLEKLAVQTGILAARAPVLITLDDVQWADAATIAALRALPTWLAECPVGWLLVRRMGARDPRIEWLFGEWERSGAVRIALGPLADDAVTDLIADVLRARPDPELLAMAHGAAGNPLLVRALLDGLRDEGGVAVAGTRARLLSGQPPRRVREVIHDWVMRLSPAARHLLEVAASVDGSFAVDDLAGLLGWPAEQVLPPLDEIVAADLLTVVEKDLLTFRHDLVRQTVVDSVPPAVRLALCGQVTGTRRLATALATTPMTDRPADGATVRGRVKMRYPLRWAGECADRAQGATRGWEGLTGAERTVAELVAQGLTNREVATRIFLSPHTVSFHLRKVYRKLGIRSRVDLTRAFVQREQDRRTCR
ncbi:regulatory LuxR family protein [Kribbella voronezhensis]|uniref:Regulatory LuxR family protein n=1 Tax=Kribbella voronezhensis TaxID=2512212 RepID=A0A4R7TI13_9ACTN|nr:LuxR family transcriptional regulator [Kribbella voronezhensis]TDU91188.1 regulatory LuxR family protein [Kribbella voronezhensis]